MIRFSEFCLFGRRFSVFYVPSVILLLAGGSLFNPCWAEDGCNVFDGDLLRQCREIEALEGQLAGEQAQLLERAEQLVRKEGQLDGRLQELEGAAEHPISEKAYERCSKMLRDQQTLRHELGVQEREIRDATPADRITLCAKFTAG